MERGKIYCYRCGQELQVIDGDFVQMHDHGERNDAYRSCLQWCEVCKRHTVRRGNRLGNACRQCVTARLKETGLFHRPDFGLNNPETHAKTIKAQVENGTGAAGDPEVRRRSRDAFLKSKPWESNPNWGTKNPETWKRTMESREVNARKRGFRSFQDYQTRACGKRSTFCDPEVYDKTRKSTALKKSVLIYEGDKIYYNHFPAHGRHELEPVDEGFVRSLLDGGRDIEYYVGLDIAYDRVCRNGFDVLTGEKISLKNSLFVLDGEMWAKYRGKTIRWNELKSAFVERRLRSENGLLVEILDHFPHAFVVSTFRDQNSETWKGTSTFFEQSLVDLRLEHFAYAKFCLETGDPVVGGKTGSLLVNMHGSDVNFSSDPRDGLFRRIMQESGLHWDRTRILVIPCKDEAEAYKIEGILHLDFGLLGG